MVGDSMEVDIKPALALGMKAFHVNATEAGCVCCGTVRTEFVVDWQQSR